MKTYLGFDFNEEHELKEAYAYKVTPEQEETITNMIYYYRHHDVDLMNIHHPGFVSSDLQKLLDILADIMEV